jgi:hypothetical protein
MSVMSRLRFVVLAMVAVVVPIVFVAGGGVTGPVARADVPGPGDTCTAFHATTKDANGRTMWCNPTMTGAHNLVWQYGGPS